MAKKAYLVLENGTVFQGFSFGAEADVIGEIVFHHRHDRVSGNIDRSQLLRSDRRADLPSDRQLRRDPRRL